MKYNYLNFYARLIALAAVGFVLPGMYVSAAEAPVPQTATSSANITGTVLDETGEPAIGASVKCKENASLSVVTDLDGHFVIRSNKAVTLEISYIGYKTVSVKAQPGVPVEVTLQPDNNALEEVVVVGFGAQKKVNLTGSVGTATAKDIAGRPVQNAAAALQGVIPGLNISNSSSGGELNASKQVNIRGTGSIGSGVSSSPLILIDGLEGDLNSVNPNDIESISVLKDAAASSIYGSRAPFGVILITTKSGSDGQTTIRYNNSFRFNQPLTPMQMMDSWEYISYLNDVASYTNPGSQEFSKDFVEGAWAYYTGESDNFIYDNKWDGTSRRWGTGECGGTFANVNWRDELYKNTAFAQEHNLTLSGGNNKVTYYVSGNFLDQDGFLKYGNDSYERYSVMGKLSGQLTNWLRVQYTGSWMRTDYDRPTIMSGGFYEKVIRRLPPTNPKYDPNGYIAADYNYIEHLEKGGRHQEQNDIFTNQVKLTITPLKGWNINAELNTRVYSDWTHQWSLPVYAHDADDLEGLSHESVHLAFDSGRRSSVSEYTKRETYLNYNIFTDYSFAINEKNNFKVMLGFQAEDNKKRTLSAWRDDLQVEELPVLDLSTATDSYGMGSEYQKWRSTGFFGRINYDFDSRYLLEANLRYDGTSRFRRGNRWVWSPSFSAGWNVDREAFWENIRPVVPSLKVRASYGQLANMNTSSWYPTYRTMGLSTLGSQWLVGGEKQNAAWFAKLISPNLTWEKIRNTNVGLDFSLFRYRLTGSFDYFWRNNHDMVGPALTYPATFGADVPQENTLSLRTYGWELQLGWQDQVNGFVYSAKFNLSDDRTKITEYPNDERYLSKYIAGEVTGNIYGLTTVGVARTQEEMDAHLDALDEIYFQKNGEYPEVRRQGQGQIGNNWQAGDLMYADIDGDGIITKGNTLDELGDLKKIGNDAPHLRFGLNLFAQWKGFDLTLFFQGVGKRDYYFSPNGGQGTAGKGAVFWGATTGGRWESIFLKDHLDYWRDENSGLGENLDAYYGRPIYYTNKNRETQTRYLQNAAYLRLKNLQVGYTIPQSVMQKLHLNNFRIFFSGENIFTTTKMSKVIDPESLEVSSMKSGSSYPIARTYSFGFTLDI